MIMFDVMNDVENSILPFPTTTTTHYVCLPPMRFCFKPLYPVLPDARNNFTWNYFLVSFRLIEFNKHYLFFFFQKSQPYVNKEIMVFTYPKKNLLIIRLRSSTRLILKSTSRWLIFCIVYLVTLVSKQTNSCLNVNTIQRLFFRYPVVPDIYRAQRVKSRNSRPVIIILRDIRGPFSNNKCKMSCNLICESNESRVNDWMGAAALCQCLDWLQ